MKLNAYATSGTSPTQCDFVCENHSSVFLLRPFSPMAFDWIAEHLPPDRMTFGSIVVIEPRYVWATSYSGTFSISQYDTCGNLPVHIVGEVKATRITVDTKLSDVL